MSVPVGEGELTVELLQQLEQIICPSCAGSGVHRSALHDSRVWGGPLARTHPKPCPICNGARRIWRRKAGA